MERGFFVKPEGEVFMRRIVITLVLVLSGLSWAVGGDMGGGDPNGSPEKPYLIEDLADFDAFAGNSAYWASGVHTTLMTDIDLSGRTYTTAVIAPDTDNTDWDFIGIPFLGTFNGNSHTIDNLTIDTTGTDNHYYLGLFGQLRSSTVVSDLELEHISITGGTYCVGGLCGSNGDWDYTGGTIINCHSNCSVTDGSGYTGGMVGLNCWGSIQNCTTNSIISGDYDFGGMVGYNYYGTITNCYTSATVSSPDNPHAIGGLVGYNEYGEINDCNSNATVSGGVNSYAVGGIVGTNDTGNVTNCYAMGTVDADGAIGNIVGNNSYGTVRNCYSDGRVIGKSYSRIGGLVGYNYFGSIIECHANDTVIAGDNSFQLGGLVGWNHGTITNSYSTGSVTGGINSYRIGGLVGGNNVTITNCYASGKVSGGTGSSNLAGLCGYQQGNSSNISNCFWDIETSGMSTGYNLDPTYPGTITNVLGKTTAEMMTQSTFTGWDFVNDWMMLRAGEDYPRLAWQEVFLGDIAGLYGVDMVDFSEVARNWQNTGCPANCEDADIDENNEVGLGDLAAVAEDWLK